MSKSIFLACVGCCEWAQFSFHFISPQFWDEATNWRYHLSGLIDGGLFNAIVYSTDLSRNDNANYYLAAAELADETIFHQFNWPNVYFKSLLYKRLHVQLHSPAICTAIKEMKAFWRAHLVVQILYIF